MDALVGAFPFNWLRRMSCANGGKGWQAVQLSFGIKPNSGVWDGAGACAGRPASVAGSRGTRRRASRTLRPGPRSSATMIGLCRRSISLFHLVTAATQSASLRRQASGRSRVWQSSCGNTGSSPITRSRTCGLEGGIDPKGSHREPPRYRGAGVVTYLWVAPSPKMWGATASLCEVSEPC